MHTQIYKQSQSSIEHENGKKYFDILLEKQKNKRKVKCFILHWLHENIITLIHCWDEKNKQKFACV